jgi:hypothetical protein
MNKWLSKWPIDINSIKSSQYYVKTVNRMSPSPVARGTRSRAGSFGQNTDLNYEYIIYVHKKDYERAKNAINK